MISPKEIDSSEDLKLLSQGCYIKKLNSKKKLKDRFFRYDFVKNQLVADSKEFMTNEKHYSFLKFTEVKRGLGVEDSKLFDKSLADLGIVVYMKDHSESLSLVAEDVAEQERWIATINKLIEIKKNPANERFCMRNNYLESPDIDANIKLKKKEVEALLKELCINTDNLKLKKLFKAADVNGDNHLDREDLERLINMIYQREDIVKIFQNLTRFQDTMSLNEFSQFLAEVQKEPKSDEEILQIINEYEYQEDLKEKQEMSAYGFMYYLLDEENHLRDPDHSKVYQDMTQPVCHYYINSSHNTYLSGDQLLSESKASCYMVAIRKGARFVEMDIYDGPDNRPLIYHGGTMTSKILLEDVLVVCGQHAFDHSLYPLVLTLELHCKEQLAEVARLIFKHLGEFLYQAEIVEGQYPSPEMLKGRIIVRAKRAEDSKSLDSTDDGELTPDFNQLVLVMQNAKFKGIDYGLEKYKEYQTSSISEVNAKKIFESESGPRIISYTNHFMVKVYPAYYRQDSSNLNAIEYWNHGFQKVALNFQTKDTSMCLNSALFADNGGCGYVLKPDVFKDPEFDPADVTTMKNKKLLHLKIISGQRFTKKNADPYVRVEVMGVKADCDQDKETKYIKNNGFDPVWNESLRFKINCPELAFVKFSVLDKDSLSKDDEIGTFTVRFHSMKEGYRHFNLMNKTSEGSIFVYVDIESQPDSI